jgi:chromosome partitioning protein
LLPVFLFWNTDGEAFLHPDSKTESCKKMKVIAIANQKGGTGKTPTTVNVGFALARKGCSVLFVDLDPQGSLSEYFLAEQAEVQEPTVYDALVTITQIEPVGIAERVDLLPAHDGLAAAEIELPNKANAQKRLAKVLCMYNNYDFCLLDCPPSLGILTFNALAAADEVIIPVKTELSAERTIKLITRTIEDVVKSDLNAGLHLPRNAQRGCSR